MIRTDDTIEKFLLQLMETMTRLEIMYVLYQPVSGHDTMHPQKPAV